MIYFSVQTPSIPTLEETQAVVQEVHQDLQQLKPNAILETIRSWTPGLLSFSYRLLYAAIIIIIGNRIAFYLRRFLKRTFDRMGMDLGLSKFLISLANAISYAIVIFMALEKIGIPSTSIIALLGSATLAIGLSLQESLGNFAGGILILVMRFVAARRAHWRSAWTPLTCLRIASISASMIKSPFFTFFPASIF